MKLYEIPEMIQRFLDAYDAGDVPEEAFDDTLESLVGDFAQKLDDCACAYKGLLAEAKEIKAEADALAARYKAKKAQADRMVAYMDKQLKRAAGLGVKPAKLETARNVLSYRTSEAVDVPDVESVVLWIQAHNHEEINGVAVNQDDLLKYKEPELSKTALKTALKAGLIVPGATVKTSFNLQIK